MQNMEVNMVLKKKVVEGAVVAGLLIAVTTTTAVTNHVVSKVSTNTNIITAQTNSTSAGIINELGTQQMNYLVAGTKDVNENQTNAGVMKAVASNIQNASEASAITVTPSDVSLTASAVSTDPQQANANEEAAQTQEIIQTDTQQVITQEQSQKAQAETVVTQNASNEATVVQNTDISINSDSVAAQIANEQAQWNNRLMANVDQFLNVRQTQDENSQIVGKLYKGDVADILERGDVWTHIKSGAVDGYVMNQYCVFGVDAYNYAKTNCETEASATTGGLRLRSEPREDASVVDLIAEGQVMTVSKDTPEVDGWIAIKYDSRVAYVSSTYVNVKLAVGTGITIAEEKAQQAAEAADKAKKEAEKASKEAKTVQKSAVVASGDDVSMLAAVIQLEAGGEPYAGKVAVGAVVMNRVRSGRFANSISGVIYQNGQFSTAGSVARVASHVSASCRQAAQEAINGADNTGGCVSFRRASSGHGGLVIGNHVFF